MEKSKKVRTRFAPSPTGYIHIGNVHTAMFAWLLARQNNGDFIIRLEDTDQKRYVEGATELIFETLKWLGLDWDEGPDIGGKYGPYTQSERKNRHIEWAQKLIEKDMAYADPYSAEEVEEFREEAKKNKKPFLYRDYRPKNPPKWDGSRPLRFKVANIKRYEWDDIIMGHLSAGPEALDDFILIKSDGMATYNFAHIVDDADMEITHIVRGLEYISSTPKYLSLYEALDLKPPIFACIPHIMAPGGKKKLGKRDGAKSVTEYRDEGILPEALFNFLATLGWNDGSEQEIFSREEILKKFHFDRVQRAGACFDEQKLIWLNGQWIRRIADDDLLARLEPYWPPAAKHFDNSYKQKIAKLITDRLKTLSDAPNLTKFFFEEPVPDISLINDNKQLSKLDKNLLSDLLQQSVDSLKNSDFSTEDIKQKLNELLVSTNQKPPILFSIIRIATTWTKFSPDLFSSLSILGKKNTLERLEKSIEYIKNHGQ